MMEHPSQEIAAAQSELKELIYRLYSRLEQLGDAEDEFEMIPEQNIKDNFICRQKMRCQRCQIQFFEWSAYDEHVEVVHNEALECRECEITFRTVIEKRNHDLLEHSTSGSSGVSSNIPLSTAKYIGALVCCSLCRRHFSDIEGWTKHYTDVHAAKTGPTMYDWMVEKCDMKGEEACKERKLFCMLCEVDIPFIADIFNFETLHANHPQHKKMVAEYFKEHNALPDKFLRGARSGTMYNPHELQSSCCCKVPNCTYCPIHKSSLTKFNQNTEVMCQFCHTGFRWKGYKSAIEHMQTERHSKFLDEYILANGAVFQFHWMFKTKHATKKKKPTPTSAASAS